MLFWVSKSGIAISKSANSISIKELADLEIAIHDLETQNNIVHLDQLKNKKLKIRRQLIELENQYINTLTYKKIK